MNKYSSILTFLVFLVQFLLAEHFVKSSLSLYAGLLLMTFLATSTYFSVKLLLWDYNPFFGFMVLFTKVPITVLVILLIFRWPKFEIYSFLIGVLIVLPCLVILSYRKL